MNNRPCIIAVIILLLLAIILLFWHPLDSLKGTSDAKAPVTTVDSTTLAPPVTPVAPKPPVVKPPVQRNNGSGTTTVIIKVVDDRAVVTSGQQQVQIQTITPPSSTNLRTTLDPSKVKTETVIFRFNADDGNHYPQLRFDELNDDAAGMQEFPYAVWNNTHDGHNLRLTTVDLNNATGDYWITEDGVIGLKAQSIQRWINNGIVDVKGSITNWAFKRMTLETINGAEYYTCRTK